MDTSGFLNAAANADIDIRGYHNKGGNVDLTINHANLVLEYVGA